MTVLLFLVLAAGEPGMELRPDTIREETRWRGWVDPGQSVEINGLAGDVRAEPAAGDELEVIARKRGRGDPDEVAIEIVEHKGGLTVCAVYPSEDPAHPFECRPSHGGGFRVAWASDSHARVRYEGGGGGDVRLTDLRVDFLVRVPHGVRLIARTVDGQVEARGLDRDVEAHTVLGDIFVELAARQGGEVRADAVAGFVSSQFPLRLKPGRGAGMSVWGRIGDARRTLRLKTITGSIHLRRAVASF